MTSEIRVNKLQNRVGLGTVTYADTGIIVSGIVTCTELSGLTALNIAGVGTASTLDINGDIDVDGHTNLDNVSIAGVTTTTGNIHLNSTDKKIYLTSDYDQYITANAASNYMVFAAGNQERLRIDSSGRVLIGNTTGGSMNAAADNLVVGSGVGHNGITVFSAADADGWLIFNDAANSNLTGSIQYNHVDNYMAFRTNTTERLRITSGGYVGINTDASGNGSGAKLVVGGRIQSNAGGYWFAGANGAEDGWHVQDSGGNLVVVESGVAERLRITSTGELRVPAGIGAQLRYENTHSVTTDAAISTFDDAAGTLLCLGSNYYFNSAGAETRYNTSEESAGIIINRNGQINFSTGGTGATATTRLRITSGGQVNIGNSLTQTSRLFSVETTYASGGEVAYIGNNDGGNNYGGLVISAGEIDRECRLESAWGNSFFTFHTQSDGAGAGERLRIQSGGNVMIGGNYTSTNLGKLCVDGVIGIDDEGSGTSTLNIMTAANTRLKIQATSSLSQILTQNGNPFAIKTDAGTGGGTERLRITSSGACTINGFLEASGGAATGHGAKLGNLSVGYDNLYNTIQALSNSTNLHLQYNVNGDIQCNEGGGDMVTADIRPRTNNAFNLGTNSYRWANIHTNDLNLSNEGNVNEVDGTWGQYTIQEGKNDLFLINRRSGKRYKFLLQEVD